MNERVFQTENAHAINQGIHCLWHPETYYKNSNGASLAMSMLRCLYWFRQSNHGLEPSPTKWLESSHSPPCWWEWHDFHDYTWHRRSAKTSHRDDLVDTSSTVSREKNIFRLEGAGISNWLSELLSNFQWSWNDKWFTFDLNALKCHFTKKKSRLRDWLPVWQLLPPQKRPTFGAGCFETNNSDRLPIPDGRWTTSQTPKKCSCPTDTISAYCTSADE